MPISSAEIMRVFCEIAKDGKGANPTSITGCVGPYKIEEVGFVTYRGVTIAALRGKLESIFQARFSNASGLEQDVLRRRLDDFFSLARNFSLEPTQFAGDGYILLHPKIARYHELDGERLITKVGFVRCVTSAPFAKLRQSWIDEDKMLFPTDTTTPAGVPVHVPPVVAKGVAVPPVAMATATVPAPAPAVATVPVPVPVPVQRSPPPPPPTPVATPVAAPAPALAPAPAPAPAPALAPAPAPAPAPPSTGNLCERLIAALDKAKVDAKAGRLYFDDGYSTIAATIEDFTVSVVQRGAKGGNSKVYDGYVDRPVSAIHKKRVHLRSKPDIRKFFGGR